MRLVERFSTVIFALAILAAGAWGQSTVTLEIPDVQGTPGTDVWINVNIIIPEGTEILSGQFTLTYDPGVLSCKEVKPGAFLMGYSPPPTGFGYRGDAGAESNVTPYIVSNVERNEAKNEVGRVNIAFAGAEPISSGSGELIKVRFGVRMSSQEGSQTSSGVSEQQSGCELNIEQPLFNEDITPEVTPGTFTPTGSPGKYIPVKVIDKDTSGVIAGATVELRDTDGEVVSSAVTGDDGMCQLAGAASGETYLVRAYKIPESSGY
ncbi:hypothetical protein J7M22_03350, partial [Candidatus Poribacteria bacterium]|nr:hypothetical protein [Candidatus Poribacteria bacterium]